MSVIHGGACGYLHACVQLGKHLRDDLGFPLNVLWPRIQHLVVNAPAQHAGGFCHWVLQRPSARKYGMLPVPSAGATGPFRLDLMTRM